MRGKIKDEKEAILVVEAEWRRPPVVDANMRMVAVGKISVQS